MYYIGRYRQWTVPSWMSKLAWILLALSTLLTFYNVFGFNYPQIDTPVNPHIKLSIEIFRYGVVLYSLLIRKWKCALISLIVAYMGEFWLVGLIMLTAFFVFGIPPNS